MKEGFKAWECIVKRGSSEQGREKTETQREGVRRHSHVGITVGKVGYIWAVWESNYPIRPGNCRGAKAQTRHERRTDGEVDEEARRSESRSDEELVQLSVLTKLY